LSVRPRIKKCSEVAPHAKRRSLGLADQRVELSPNVGDGRGQGGLSFRYDSFGSVGKFAPRAIFGNWLRPLKRRQLFSAASPSLMTLVVRRCFSVRLGSRSVAMFDQALECCFDEGVERSQRWTGSEKVGMAPRCLSLGDFVAEVCAEDFQRRVIPPL
jgi:hypothetical protein